LASKVALVKLDKDVAACFERAVKLVGGMDDLNSAKRPVVVKVGVFNHRNGQHTTVGVVGAIAKSLDRAPRIFIAESNNYRGTGSERLQIWKDLFKGKVNALNLSDDTETREVKIADETIGLSHILFKPNVFVSTHALRKSDRGTILKNLLGLIPDKKKVRFHKKLETTLLDAYEAIGRIDLAVLDATYTYPNLTSSEGVKTDALLVGRDAVAVEAVGAALVGLNPEDVPVIREAVKRGLGEGKIDNIKIVGASFEDLKKEFDMLIKAHAKSRRPRQGAQTWGGLVHRVFKDLMQENYFKTPNRRTVEDVAKALEDKGILMEGKQDKVKGFLVRRVKSGTLKSTKVDGEWVYWTD
jgi:uncharacterized protein (DUF362 family)